MAAWRDAILDVKTKTKNQPGQSKRQVPKVRSLTKHKMTQKTFKHVCKSFRARDDGCGKRKAESEFGEY